VTGRRRTPGAGGREEEAPMSGERATDDAFERSTPVPGVALIRITAKPLGVLTVAARRRLTAAIGALADSPAVRCAVLTGQGPAFSAGSNIREFEVTTEWIEGARVQEVALNECIADSPVPIVAACNGVTLGGGAVMALACDVRVAAASATFGFPEVKLGAMAGATGTQRLAQLVGPGHAPAVSPAAVRATKRCVRGGLAGGYAAGMRLEAEVTAPLGLTADAIEGTAAFLEKRAPAF
jgi:enoyl-CoA hydratase/carnithine racemase